MKPHYPILDGLRGTAAILVVIFHLFETYYPDMAKLPLHHGYLAVDFFYMLSGFVLGYAYDDRWGRMSMKEFLKIRLVRLHPLVIAGVLVGGFCFWVDPFKNPLQDISLLKLSGALLISFTLLPSPDVRGWGETHSLNGPCWSLLQEYLASMIYALFGRRMSRRTLWIWTVISGLALTALAAWRGNLGTGWSYETFWMAPVRMMFPFFAGLLLFRSGRLLNVPFAFPVCSLLLIVLFMFPVFQYNGLYEAACIILAFPLIVAAGAGGRVQGRWARLCKFSGDISYPVYILHYPFIYIYASWVGVWTGGNVPPTEKIVFTGFCLFIFFILLGYGALKLYDEPVRNWLRGKMADRKQITVKKLTDMG